MDNYREYLQPGVPWDSGGLAFCHVLRAGLRSHHRLLDFGCGAFRIGRFLAPYLEWENYYGIEPNKDIFERGVGYELFAPPIDMGFSYSEHFKHNDDFDLTVFGEAQFDYILACSIINHAAHWQIDRMLETAGRALKPNGIFIGDHRPEGEDYLGDEWVYPGLTPHYPYCFQNGMRYEKLVDDPYGSTWFTLR